MKFIAYYRVSTSKQGISGLGLEAQRANVFQFVQEREIIAEFTDIESGKKNNRAELFKAIGLAKKENATLVIAKLDRLSRDVNFISGLMKSEVTFIACDQPQANKFTLHIFAALAEQERDMISERTRLALAALKRRGVKLGSPQNLTVHARLKAVARIKEKAAKNENNIKAAALITSLKNQGLSFCAITKELNESGFKTSRSKIFQVTQVVRIWQNQKRSISSPDLP